MNAGIVLLGYHPSVKCLLIHNYQYGKHCEPFQLQGIACLERTKLERRPGAALGGT